MNYHLSLLSLVFFVCVNAEPQESISAVIQELKILKEEIRQLKAAIPRIEKKLSNDVQMSEIVVKSEFSGTVRNQVRDAITDAFRKEPVSEMLKSHVLSDIQTFKHEHKQMGKQYKSMLRKISRMEREKTAFQEGLSRDYATKIQTLEKVIDEQSNDLKAVGQKVRALETKDSELMDKLTELIDRIEAAEAQIKADSVNRYGAGGAHKPFVLDDVQNFGNMTDNQTYVLKYLLQTCSETAYRVDDLGDLLDDLKTFKKNLLKCKLDSKFPLSMPSSVTALPDHAKRSRLLITSSYTEDTVSQQMTLDGHDLSPYPYLNLSLVISTEYDPSRNIVVFARYNPDGIYGMKLDGSDVIGIYSFVGSYGIAVDHGRQLIFFTTYSPQRRSVSRVTTYGRDFVYLIDLRKRKLHASPAGIALDGKNNMIYVTTHRELLCADYDGENIHQLHKGRSIRGVTLDLERRFVYFSDGDRILRHSLSQRNSTEVVASSTIFPRNMKYYNNTVYISSKFNGDIYGLDVLTNNLTRLATVDQRPLICLIP